MNKSTHVFELAGLGLAPFTFVGFSAGNTYQACPGAPTQPGGSCDYCGTAISNYCFIESRDGQKFKVGTDCVNKTGDAGLRQQVKAARAKIAADKREVKKAARREKEKVDTDARAEKFINETPGLREALDLADKHSILADLRSKLFKYGPLSERQVELALKLVVQIRQREAEALEPKVPVVAGTRAVAGTIISTRSQESDYGIQFKMLVKLTTGEKVWGSIPTDFLSSQRIDELRQKKISFTASFEPSHEDPCFGFFKRPRKATLAA